MVNSLTDWDLFLNIASTQNGYQKTIFIEQKKKKKGCVCGA